MRPSILLYLARHLVSTQWQRRALSQLLRSSYIYTVLTLHSALWRPPRGWGGPPWTWVWRPCFRRKACFRIFFQHCALELLLFLKSLSPPHFALKLLSLSLIPALLNLGSLPIASPPVCSFVSLLLRVQGPRLLRAFHTSLSTSCIYALLEVGNLSVSAAALRRAPCTWLLISVAPSRQMP